MKPLRLSMTAFGPYSKTVVVDFERLSAAGVFLVHGPTGAGKTTILDALSFALYGVTSGGERTAKQMRSDFATAAHTTEVTLTFSARDALYRVHRIPEQERRKKRGDGVTVGKGEVRFSKIERDATGHDVEETLATKVTDVDARIAELLGLTAEQFRQVVVLPQGRFRELLVASSTKREEILETLFETVHYRQIEEALGREERRLRDAVEDLQRREAQVIDHAAATGVLDVAQERAAVAARVRELDADRERLHARGKQVRDSFERTKAAAGAHVALHRARADFTTWEAHASERKARASRLRQAERGVLVRADLEAAAAAKDRAGRAAESVAKAEAAWTKATERTKVVEQEFAAAQSAAPAGSDDAIALRESLPALLEVERLRGDGARMHEAVKTATRDLEKVTAQLHDATQARARAKEALADAQRRAHNLEPRRERLMTSMRAEQQFKKVRGLVRDGNALRVKLAELDATIDLATAAQTRHREALDALRAAQSAHYAAALSSTLRAGEPCPVCGAEDHPSPAAHESATSEMGSIAAAAALVDEDTERLADLNQTRSNLDRDLHGIDRMRAGLWESLAPHLGEQKPVADTRWSSPDFLDELEEIASAEAKRIDALRSDLEDAEAASDALATLEDALKHAKALAEDLEHAKTVMAERCQRATADALHADENLNIHLRDHPLASTTTHADALRRLRDLDAEKSAHATRVAKIERTVFAAKADAQTAAALFAASTREKESAFEAQRTAEAKLAAALEAAEFSDADVARAATLDAPSMEKLRHRVDADRHEEAEWQRALKNAERDVEAAGEIACDDEALGAAQHAVDVIEQQLTEFAQERGRATEQLANLVRWADDLATTSQRLEEAQQAHAAIARVAGVAAGQNASKITFQRWVLATLLDDVLETASVRLLQMTRGRYALKRRLDPRGRGGRGLDLDVIDHETQVERPAATLSGGESFLAALALALGLADAVRARAGGVMLDAIFLDEGFAGLDPEALDLALATLQELMDSGRMVGIISHVDELKERIGQGLEVISGRGGSRVVAFG